MMDGCGYFRYFFYITLPLSGPILATVAVITFVDSWNGYLLPLIVLNSESNYPWTLGLMAYQGQYSTQWQLVLAFITLTILPAIIMFLMASAISSPALLLARSRPDARQPQVSALSRRSPR